MYRVRNVLHASGGNIGRSTVPYFVVEEFSVSRGLWTRSTEFREDRVGQLTDKKTFVAPLRRSKLGALLARYGVVTKLLFRCANPGFQFCQGGVETIWRGNICPALMGWHVQPGPRCNVLATIRIGSRGKGV